MRHIRVLLAIAAVGLLAGAGSATADPTDVQPPLPACSAAEPEVECEEADDLKCCATGEIGTICLLDYKKKIS